MFTVMLIFHALVCIMLVIVILMQAAKGEGLAGAFGGGGGSLGGAVFGGRGAATFLSKATTVIAIVFMVNCGILAFMSARQSVVSTADGTSIVVEQAQKEMERQAAQQQATPASDNADGSLFPTEGTSGDNTLEVTPIENSGSSLFPSDEKPAEPAGSGN